MKIRKIIIIQEIDPGGHDTPVHAWHTHVGCAHLEYFLDLVFLSFCLFPKIKNLYIPPEPVNLRITEKSPVFFSLCFPGRSGVMSSQDSEGESYVVDYIGYSKVYGDVEHYGWTLEDEEDHDHERKEETSSEEDEVPLPQPGDMHVEFKKSSLPSKAKRPKTHFIPFRLLQEISEIYAKRCWSLSGRSVN